MTTNALIPQKRGDLTGNTRDVIVPREADKHARSRLGRFARWMTDQALPWHAPDLARYRDAMLVDGKAPSTVSAHLSTVRARYAALMRDDRRRDDLYTLAGGRLPRQFDRCPGRKVHPSAQAVGLSN
jgi:hypothetical protein